MTDLRAKGTVAQNDKQAKIMVVDDDKAVRDVLSEFLQMQGVEVVPAANGAEALEKIKHTRPDAVLLDVRMPEMDGVEVLRRIRADDSKIPVLMITGNEDARVAQETVALGAFDYILKPLDLEYLRRAVERMLLSVVAPPTGPTAAASLKIEPSAGGLVYDLAVELFKTTRTLPGGAQSSLGASLEAVALSLIQKNAPAEKAEMVRMLNQIRTLIRFGLDLGDFNDETHRNLEACVVKARRSLGLT